MEALTAVAVAALTIYDMVKAVDKEMVIGEICLVEKKGGRSGHYRRQQHRDLIGCTVNRAANRTRTSTTTGWR